MRPIVRTGNDHSPRRNRAAWGIFFALVPLGTLAVTIIITGVLISGGIA